MGAGRSGTTLLDTILGNNPGIFSAGELNRFPKYYGTPLLVEDDSPTARFWGSFKSKFPVEMQADRFRTMHQICHSFEYHSNFYKLWVPVGRRQLPAYQEYLKNFFTYLQSLTDAPVIVDSSKYPLRGYYLARFLPVEVTFIYIRRNPMDVVRSFAKKGIEQPSQGWLSANIYMFIVNSLCLAILRLLNRNHKMVSIRYHDLVADPETTLTVIGKALDIKLDQSIHLARSGGPFQKGMLFDGNRIRLEKEIRLHPVTGESKPQGLQDYLTLLFQRMWWKQKSN